MMDANIGEGARVLESWVRRYGEVKTIKEIVAAFMSHALFWFVRPASTPARTYFQLTLGFNMFLFNIGI